MKQRKIKFSEIPLDFLRDYAKIVRILLTNYNVRSGVDRANLERIS